MTKFFYCSAVYDRKYSLIAGPFFTHDEALDALPAAKSAALETDPRYSFSAFGTCSFDAYMGAGHFNKAVDLN